MLQKAIITTVDYCTRFATQVIGIALLLAVVSGIYAARHFAIDADVNKLISFDLPWRQREVTFEKFFAPKEEAMLAVVDAPTSELATQATAALVAKLSDQKDLFHAIHGGRRRPVLPEERPAVPADPGGRRRHQEAAGRPSPSFRPWRRIPICAA